MTQRGGGEARQQGQTIPVVNEELKVGKRAVTRGGVRVYSHMTEKPVEESVRLQEEHVHVERRAANRRATEAELTNAANASIEFTETAEEPVVTKEARVVEELIVGKDVQQRTETVRDTVRRSDVQVNPIQADTRGAAGNEPLRNEAARNDVTSRDANSGDADLRSHYQNTFASSGGRYEDYAPAYSFGDQMARDERYRGRNFNVVEADLRQDYQRAHPDSSWERLKAAVRYGWDRVSGTRSRGTSA
jgi:uncharacterized protein (TIGR02271 family)